MKQTIGAHLFMELDYPTRTDGTPDFYAEKVWTPTIWKGRVSDEYDRIYVGTRQIEIEVPDDFNPIPLQVAALELEKAEVLEAYQRSVASINERLSKLLAITCN